MIHWELLRKNGKTYKIIETSETEEFDPSLPRFKKEKSGDVILGHKFEHSEVEAYYVE